MSFPNDRNISTSTVRPASRHSIDDTTDQGIQYLTPWDIIFLGIQYMEKGLLFAKPQPTVVKNHSKEEEEEITNMINHLKTSLSHTLKYFFPLAGRLGFTKHDDDDDVNSVHINCNSAGVEFIHAAADITISDILSPTYVPLVLVDSLFSLKGVMNNYQGHSQPLVSVQVTELIDGIFIGCSLNHAICDGTSFWHFLNSWSEISRSSSSSSSSSDHGIAHPPVLERWFLENTDLPIRLPFSSTDQLKVVNNFTSTPFEERCFHFTAEKIAKLKAKANSESESSEKNMISSLQALLAHVWVAVTRARRLDPDQETRFLFLAGNRSKLNPPLSEFYFGNSVSLMEATARVGELLERGLGWGASLMNQVVRSHGDASIRSFLKSWMEKPFVPTIDDFISITPILVVRSSPRFDMYGNDFGWGKPIAIRTGMNGKSSGMITVSPGPVEGSVDIEICLPLEMLKVMEDDIEFMEFVTVSPSCLSI